MKGIGTNRNTQRHIRTHSTQEKRTKSEDGKNKRAVMGGRMKHLKKRARQNFRKSVRIEDPSAPIEDPHGWSRDHIRGGKSEKSPAEALACRINAITAVGAWLMVLAVMKTVIGDWWWLEVVVVVVLVVERLVDDPLDPVDEPRDVGVDAGQVLAGAADAPRHQADQRRSVAPAHSQRSARITLPNNKKNQRNNSESVKIGKRK